MELDITSKNINLRTVQWYELIVAIAYWYRHGAGKRREVVENTKTTKPEFTTYQIESAFESYKRLKDIS